MGIKINNITDISNIKFTNTFPYTDYGLWRDNLYLAIPSFDPGTFTTTNNNNFTHDTSGINIQSQCVYQVRYLNNGFNYNSNSSRFQSCNTRTSAGTRWILINFPTPIKPDVFEIHGLNWDSGNRREGLSFRNGVLQGLNEITNTWENIITNLSVPSISNPSISIRSWELNLTKEYKSFRFQATTVRHQTNRYIGFNKFLLLYKK